MSVRIPIEIGRSVMNVRLGRWSKFLAPGYGHCERCKTPWKFVAEHVTNCVEVSFDPPQISEGMFALCQKCWDELTPTARLMHYASVWLRHDRDDPDGEKWARLRHAVLAGR